MNWLSTFLENVPDDPFYGPRKPLWLPREMSNAPPLPPPSGRKPVPRTALLINPFYAKSPHGSFGKHVLTPTLALTSLAGATPAHWQVRYWDENLLQGLPPAEPFPEVAGITVHLTFAKRAYELAAWFRAQGSKVILGGLHTLSRPDEVAPHADAMAIGDGVQLWPEILRDVEHGELKPRYEANFERPFALDPPPRRNLLPRKSFLTTTSLIATRGCHNRCGFCYLATDGLRMPYRVREPEDVRLQFEADDQPYAVFIDNNLGSKHEYLRELCRALRPARKIWSAAVTLDITDDPSLVREMALAGCTGVFIGFESLTDQNLVDARKRTPRAEDYARRVRIFHELGIQVNGSFVVGFDGDRKDTFTTLVQWIRNYPLDIRLAFWYVWDMKETKEKASATIQEFLAKFSTAEACLQHLFDTRFGQGHVCPSCNKKAKWYRIQAERAYSCQWCGHHIHPTVGTPFEDSRTPLQLWFYAIYLFTTSRHGVPAKELERQLGVTYKTAWRMADLIRKHMAQIDDEWPLFGDVEIDETYVGGRTQGMGRHYTGNKAIVFGMMQRNGQVMTKVVQNVAKKTLQPIIEENVLDGSTVHTDELRSYKGLNKAGYNHKTVNHGAKEYVVGDTHVNGMENFWKHLKGSIRSTHIHVSKKHLHKYAKEFEFRFNRRESASSMLPALLSQFPKP